MCIIREERKKDERKIQHKIRKSSNRINFYLNRFKNLFFGNGDLQEAVSGI